MEIMTDILEDEDHDISYLKYLYPNSTKNILPLIEDECDKMEYAGSPMFDQYPDKITFQIKAKEIAQKLKKRALTEEHNALDEEKDNNAFRDLVEILLFHEIFHRRHRYKNYL